MLFKCHKELDEDPGEWLWERPPNADLDHSEVMPQPTVFLAQPHSFKLSTIP